MIKKGQEVGKSHEGTIFHAIFRFLMFFGNSFVVEKTNVLARGHVSPHRLVDILGAIRPSKAFVMHTLAPETKNWKFLKPS